MITRQGRVLDPLPALRSRFAGAAGISPVVRQRRGQRFALLLLGLLLLPLLGLDLIIGTGWLPVEFSSASELLGLPLIAWGEAPTAWVAIGGTAKGIVAIGGIAVGVIALGGLAVGPLALGGVGIGLISLGGIGLAIVMGVGGLAVGYYSSGGLAIGAFAYAGNGVAFGYFEAQGDQKERLLFL
jgi:hypothetical protein